MIYGIGTDLVDMDRIKKMKSISTFAKKILGELELRSLLHWQVKLRNIILESSLLEKRRMLRRLVQAFADPIFPKDIQILRNSLGKPEVFLSAGAKSHVQDLGIIKSHVSLADESNHLIAFAVLET